MLLGKETRILMAEEKELSDIVKVRKNGQKITTVIRGEEMI